MTLSHQSFSSQSRLGFFLQMSAHFSALSILTILLDKCPTKSFEDMNILIKAILKFCTTNQLFKVVYLMWYLSLTKNLQPESKKDALVRVDKRRVFIHMNEPIHFTCNKNYKAVEFGSILSHRTSKMQ